MNCVNLYSAVYTSYAFGLLQLAYTQGSAKQKCQLTITKSAITILQPLI